uniref:Uncharacterized protein n=1 Tax=Physcomitrium patens TaxID=3218 RepID=A0A2K1JSD3_PHYPA|nr:hypothetical protein PHYPA_016740 [Physcomitrium patens]
MTLKDMLIHFELDFTAKQHRRKIQGMTLWYHLLSLHGSSRKM